MRTNLPIDSAFQLSNFKLIVGVTSILKSGIPGKKNLFVLCKPSVHAQSNQEKHLGERERGRCVCVRCDGR
ncbi:hypothetical protein L2E82_43204 [Cichorium intybus]|uniref:Uncharacterized protein n=1 Tax=Cichorium intybus TaxID=13427 RepID=A0ACB8ZN70_CICIN|nr:hypothetical protein L2E82_43204 [Cichorium intybus]